MNVIKQAKEHLILYHPFFAYLALQINFVEDSQVSKSSIDGVTFKYNPDYIKTLDVRECAGLIAHAMSHVLLLHPLRTEHKEVQRWDKATDYAVNAILKEAHIPIMNDLYDSKYNNVSAESIYEQLEEDEQEEPNDSNSNENEQGQGNSGNSNASEQNDSPSDGDNESDGVDGSDICEVEIPIEVGVSDAEQETRMTQKIMEAAMQAEYCGSQLTEAITAIVNQLKEPKKDWREILLKFAAEIARNDYDWEQPDLQYLQRNLYIPSLNSLDIGGIIFARDSSSSVNETILASYNAELKEALSQLTAEITIIDCDTEVRQVVEVQVEDIDKTPVIGRGGTKFSPVFNYIVENGLNPRALIYFTDGQCYETLIEPEYPVLWCIYENKNFIPQFGETIFVDN